MNKPNQRIGSASNADVGNKFELAAQEFFANNKNLELERNFRIAIGVGKTKKLRAFDLGSNKEKVLVECKSHTWTATQNVPSAKLSVWNETMYYFSLAPSEYRKILFVLRDFSDKRNETLAKYYIRTHRHLIPDSVEFWEFDEQTQIAMEVPINQS